MGTLYVSFTASNQIQASRGLFSLESVGSQFASSGTGAGPLTVVTSSLTNATVGQLYSFTLSASGGQGSYSWNLVSCTPNTDLWLSISNGAITGIPQLTETESVTVQVTDSLGATAQANLNLVVTVTGPLSITHPPSIPTGYYSAATATQNGIFALRMLASGGQPPYWWSFSGPAFTATGGATGTLYAMSNFGWLMGANTASSGIDTLLVVVTDNNGDTVSQTVSVHASSTLQPYPKDSVTNTVNLPDAYAGTLYQYQLHASAGSGSGYTYTVVSGMPTGLTLSSSGLISGSPASSGSAIIVLQVHDSGSNTTSFACALNIKSKNQVARPAYNTGTGYFVDGNGLLRDSAGFLFPLKGLNRTHYDSASWANLSSGALAYPNCVRVFMFDGSTAAFAANQVSTQYSPNNIASILTLAGISGTGTSGNTTTALLQSAMADWVSYESTLAPVMNQIIINLANEWGPVNSTAWRDAYLYQSGSISNISGTTVTISTVSGSNPFAASPFAYISGAGGITNQVVSIAGTGGSSGAWTITIGVSLSGYTSGGTLYGGAVGIARGAGYTCPILIDTGQSGEDPFDIVNYSVAINNSDPQKNCIFSLHPYQSALPWQAIIRSVTQGNPTVITLESNSTYHPLNPGASTNGANNFINQFLITGAQGLTNLNGLQPSDAKNYGSQNNWQNHLSVDSSGWIGTYVADSASIYLASTTGQRSLDYRYICSLFITLQSSGVCAIIGEFGPGNQSGNPLTPESALNSQQVAPGQIMSAADSYGLGYIPWAWDDHNSVVTFPAQFANNYFAMVLGNNGVYTANSQFTAFGLDVVANPRYGLWSRAQSSYVLQSSSFNYYISPTGDDNNAGTLAAPWSITALNSKQSTYAGKRIGFLPGTYTQGTVGGVHTTLYAMLQAQSNGYNGEILSVQGGPNSSNVTYLGSCNSAGYSNTNGTCPQTAIIDCSNPVGGALPTVSGAIFGQVYGHPPPNVSQYGNVTFDGLVIRNFTFSAILLQGNATNNYYPDNVLIQNCELYNAQNVVSNQNPAAIWGQFMGGDGGAGLTVQNCCIHDLQSNAGGSADNYQHFAILTLNGTKNTVVKNVTTFASLALAVKDGWQQTDASYNYFGFGKSSGGYNRGALTNDGDTVENYVTNTGLTVRFHHNIVVGPMGSWGESGQANQGTCLIYHNTFFKFGGVGGTNAGLVAWGDIGTATSGGTGNFQFNNNLVYAADGKYDDGSYGPGTINKYAADTGGSSGSPGWSTLTNVDYNVYGSNGGTGSSGQVGASFAKSFSTLYSFAQWKALAPGYDAHSIQVNTNPFSVTPLEPNSGNGPIATSAFTVTGPAATASSTGGPAGAVDGTGNIGCNWTPLAGNQ